VNALEIWGAIVATIVVVIVLAMIIIILKHDINIRSTRFGIFVERELHDKNNEEEDTRD
jgi:hypothetical protein